MSKSITDKQQKILDVITEYTQLNGYPPSVREIGKCVGLKSSSTVFGHLSRLEKKGYIKRDSSKPRAIKVLSVKR
ncbi:hypothetical protein EZV73_26745 [Acidaminobacter sp. JC074]|uniref:LexA family protein n=1 Tax=Acidaminobacter sp. JC074 TaxID=2530199 RepID=UPI001F111148|nr:hypothetical protein [Acidaminobacter sp. JC074]MCH4891206.1 hypothetical protein [Acidaminobacter sp. JC074]